MIDKMENTREEFPPIAGSSKQKEQQAKHANDQQEQQPQEEQQPEQQQPQPQPNIDKSQNSDSNVVCNQKTVVNKIFRLKIVPPFQKKTL